MTRRRELAAAMAVSSAAVVALSGCWVRTRTAYTTTVHVPSHRAGEVRAVYVARPGTFGETGAVPHDEAGFEITASSGAEVATGVSGSTTLATSASAEWTWSATGGWVPTSAATVMAGGATSGGVSGEAATSSATLGGGSAALLPRLGGLATVTGLGVRLSALASAGVTVHDCACSLEGEIAALARLVPFAGADLGTNAVVLGNTDVRVEIAAAHDALSRAGGSTSMVMRVYGGAPVAPPPPLRVHLVIDASTSMRSRWADVKAAALTLVDRLGPADELQIVVYGDDARVAFPAAAVGDGRAARAVLRGLRCGGRTNIEAGLRAAYDAAASVGSIVLLLSDGVPLGGAAGPDDLGDLAASARRAHGVTTFTIGLGSEFHAGILHALATRGGGDFRIAPRTSELEALLAAAIEARGRVVGSDFSLRLSLGAGVTLDASVPLDPRLSVDGDVLMLETPSVTAASETTILVPVVVRGGATLIGTAEASWVAHAARTDVAGVVYIAAGDSAVVSGGMGLALDVELGQALAQVATAVENGDGAAARALLYAHAARVEATVGARASAAADERANASRAFGLELERLTPDASHTERRTTAATILEWSLSFGR